MKGGGNRIPKGRKELTKTIRPSRERAGSEPLAIGDVGDPPAHLESDLVKAWREIVAQAPRGVLTRSDRLIVEHACRLLAAIRSDNAKTGTFVEYRRTIESLGLSPASRSRLSVPPPPQPNPFAEL